MGILKSGKLKGIRLVIAALIITVMVAGATVNTYAAQTHHSDAGGSNSSSESEKTVEYTEERIEEIPFKTFYQYSSDLASGESVVGVEGENGTKKVVGKVLTEDGKIVGRKEVLTTVIKEAVDEIILIGSLWDLPEMNYTFEDGIPAIEAVYDKSVYVSLPDESKGGKSGREIVNFALKYIGTPYVWGGTSLTGGCDCSGFVYAVFNACGYDVPRNGFEDFYPISMDEIIPGDIISYPDHYSIYIGGGMEISALNWNCGVCITPVGYVSSYYNAVRVITE